MPSAAEQTEFTENLRLANNVWVQVMQDASKRSPARMTMRELRQVHDKLKELGLLNSIMEGLIGQTQDFRLKDADDLPDRFPLFQDSPFTDFTGPRYLPALLLQYSNRTMAGTALCNDCPDEGPITFDECRIAMASNQRALYGGACIACWARGKEKSCMISRWWAGHYLRPGTLVTDAELNDRRPVEHAPQEGLDYPAFHIPAVKEESE